MRLQGSNSRPAGFNGLRNGILQNESVEKAKAEIEAGSPLRGGSCRASNSGDTKEARDGKKEKG